MKRLLLVLVLTVLFLPKQGTAQTSIFIDHVEGLYDGKVKVDTPIRFHIRWINNYGSNIKAFAMGYRVFLRNNIELLSGTFEPVDIITFPDFFSGFDFAYDTLLMSNGVGVDTVGVYGVAVNGSGILNGFDEIAYIITTSVSSNFVGDSLCIDSTFIPPTLEWLWTFNVVEEVIPDWSGPHCYEILLNCCNGERGDLNNPPDGNVDISDLIILISFMFQGGQFPACEEEADFNGNGSIDLSDLVLMVAYMFQSGSPPADCQ